MQKEMLAVIRGEDIDVVQFFSSLSNMIQMHSRRVALLTKVLLTYAMEEHLYEDEPLLFPLEDIQQAVLYHDIGMKMIPQRILLKTQELTPAEHKVIQRHTGYGCKLLDRYRSGRFCPSGAGPLWLLAAEIAQSHHERWDGKGYPFGLLATACPLVARATAIADSYDSIVSGTPYRIALPHEYAVLEICDNAGAQFDPLLADIFRRHCEAFVQTVAPSFSE